MMWEKIKYKGSFYQLVTVNTSQNIKHNNLCISSLSFYNSTNVF